MSGPADVPGPPRLTIDHCVIAVSDWGRSNRFYGECWSGGPPADRWFGHYRFATGSSTCMGRDSRASASRWRRQSDLCFVWPGPIEDAVAHLERHGVAIEAGPLEGSNGAGGNGRHVYFRDPDGSLLEFVSYEVEHGGR